MEDTLYNYLSVCYNKNDESLINNLMILSLNGLYISYNRLKHYLSENLKKIQEGTDSYQSMYGLNVQRFKVVGNHMKSMKEMQASQLLNNNSITDTGDNDKRKTNFDYTISLITNRNETNENESDSYNGSDDDDDNDFFSMGGGGDDDEEEEDDEEEGEVAKRKPGRPKRTENGTSTVKKTSVRTPKKIEKDKFVIKKKPGRPPLNKPASENLSPTQAYTPKKSSNMVWQFEDIQQLLVAAIKHLRNWDYIANDYQYFKDREYTQIQLKLKYYSLKQKFVNIILFKKYDIYDHVTEDEIEEYRQFCRTHKKNQKN